MLAAITVAGYLRPWAWTGLRAAPGDDSPRSKTLWDWLQLLIVPAVLAAGAIGINSAQTHRDQKREDKRTRQQDKIAADGRRDDALRSYLQQMSGLIANDDLARAGRGGNNSLAGLAQSLTLTVLRQLDGPRKGQVVQFLVDSELITNDEDRVIDMYGANLRGARLGGAFLVNAWFNGADFTGAELRKAVLNNANLSTSNLRGADFSETYYADIEGAALEADFSETCLTGARFTDADLYDSKFVKAEGRDVDFSAADLERADFKGAKLTNVKARHTTYDDATLPKGWRPRGGLRMAKKKAAMLCEGAVVAPP